MYFDRRSTGPGVHALVVGVGRYPHLTGALAYDGHGDLTSPPVSAVEFARFVADESTAHWAAPVATIDLLVSGADAGGMALPYADASRANLQRAYDAWLRRCAEHEDNIGIFYFCGHGVQDRSQLLLTSDFGQSVNQPFSGAFDFDLTRQALRQHGPATQCVFIDACRIPLTDAVMRLTGGALPLGNPGLYDPDRCRFDLTVRAPMNERMTGPPRAVSYFTAALTRALNGQAAEDEDDYGNWVVTNMNVIAKFSDIHQHVMGPERTAPSLDFGTRSASRVLRRLRRPPETALSISCDPPSDDGRRFRCDGADASFERAAADGEPWELLAPAGVYKISADEEGVCRAGPLTVLALPPRRRVTLRPTT
jgi:hypothetical protein